MTARWKVVDVSHHTCCVHNFMPGAKAGVPAVDASWRRKHPCSKSFRALPREPLPAEQFRLLPRIQTTSTRTSVCTYKRKHLYVIHPAVFNFSPAHQPSHHPSLHSTYIPLLPIIMSSAPQVPHGTVNVGRTPSVASHSPTPSRNNTPTPAARVETSDAPSPAARAETSDAPPTAARVEVPDAPPTQSSDAVPPAIDAAVRKVSFSFHDP